MITTDLDTVLATLDRTDLHCRCPRPDTCRDVHAEHEDLPRGEYGLAFVHPDGRLHRAANAEAFGQQGAQYATLADVLAALDDWTEYLHELVVVHRDTRQTRPAADVHRARAW
ncbi:hypothetical protein GCM10022243_48750 [Saccharothrix violaceirubra]|uniref:Uncharacterized protein n=1 Tax=Saccharothrix violaceirubra TaxID=413306 RepID=A0A7W7WU30_9PSEU|nr:hypothetical protein [Saccharothrix violaceirubra]MBB4963784.1 hypothetical protein [Saccharothrix violaceirubra]